MNDIIKSCLEKGFLLESDLLNLLKKIYEVDGDICKQVIELIYNIQKDKILTKAVFSEHAAKIIVILNNYALSNKSKETGVNACLEILKTNFLGINKAKSAQSTVQETKSKAREDPLLAGYNSKTGVNIVNSYNLPTRKISVGDFVRHFRNRFLAFKGFLQEHLELQNLVSINKISQQKQNISVIGMVFSKRWTKNKNLLFEVEDLTGKVPLLVNASKEEILKKAKDIMLDDIVGFRCSGNQDILFANDIVFPETKNNFMKKSPEECYAAFTSDLHVGSNKFLENNFRKFVKWLNAEIGSEKQKELASKIRYLFIVGDTVDGIGVYPGQEDLLDIIDIKKQYELLAELLGSIRKDINIILCPGQHDCVRVAEPQPPLDKSIAAPLYNIPNLFLVSNPALVNICSSKDFPGFNVLMYHGASFHSFVNDIEELRFSNAHHNPSKIIKYVLQKRHLAPTHSSVTYIPSQIQDPLTIQTVPDIITTGEIHRPEVARYNNILSIQCSCWQTITSFEEKVGNEPDPCKVPILNLKTNQVSILDFS